MWYPCDFSDCTSTGSEDYKNNCPPTYNDDLNITHNMQQQFNNMQQQWNISNRLHSNNIGLLPIQLGYGYPYTLNHVSSSDSCNFLTHEERTLEELLPLTTEDLIKLQNNEVNEEYSPGGSKEEYSPGGSEDILSITGGRCDIFGKCNTIDSSHRKKKYSTAELKPDSSLPPVIRRRNRNRRKLLAASLVEGSSSASQWDSDSGKAVQRMRSQSISDEQWAQMMAAQAAAQFTQGHTQQDIAAIAAARRGFNASGSSTRPSNFNNRGMVSSASVCDLNSLSHQPQQQQMMNSQGANSFQQLNMMGYTPGMMWPPCELCQGVPMGYPSSVSSNGMKRTASNLSMNLSSVGSDVSTGYPWAPPPPHMHHHMPFYPGCYPPPGCHSHMTHGVPMQGSAVSIPDSMQSFNKVPPSPAPSVRSSSHRSHKSSKSRSFSNADAKSSRSSRNKSRHQSEESEESLTSSGSEDGEAKVTKNTFPNSHLAWQCDHCTFINPGNARACGMCSKTTAIKHNRKGSDKKRSERRKDKEKSRKTDHEDDDRNISDYDNENSVLKSNLSLGIKDYKKETRLKSNKSSNRYRKKSRRRDSSYDSASPSISDLEDEERQLERQLKELRLTARSRQSGDYEASQNRSRNKDRNSRRKEGKRK